MNPLLIRRRGMMMAQTAMVPIEWLGIRQGTYVNTGYIPQGQDESFFFKLFLNPYPTNLNYAPWWTARTNANTASYRIIRHTSDGKIDVNNSRVDAQSQIINIQGVNHAYEVEFYLNRIVINGTTTGLSSQISTTTNTAPLIIGEASPTRGVSENVYYFRVEKNGVVTLDLIPVRVGTVGYMYDRVSGTLHGNDGGGAFIVGPDIQ